MDQSIKTISVLKPQLNEDRVKRMINNEHTWFMGLLPPRSFRIEEYSDILVPYILTGVSYYKNINRRRRCYVFSNMDTRSKSGVISIDNLEFVDMDAPENTTPISINEEAHAAEIRRYCNFDLLVRNYRKYIDWNIDILEVRKIYRLKRMVRYSVNGKQKTKDIFMDNMILK